MCVCAFACARARALLATDIGLLKTRLVDMIGSAHACFSAAPTTDGLMYHHASVVGSSRMHYCLKRMDLLRVTIANIQP